MSRIDISEEDLDAAPDAQVVYGPVGGTPHPNVYGPVTTAPPSSRAPSELAVATWVLVTAAVVLSVTFAVGGFFAGRAGHISQSNQQAERQAERAQFEAQRSADVADARAATRKAERARANDRVERVRESAYKRGRDAGFADGLQQGRSDTRVDSYAQSCLTAVGC